MERLLSLSSQMVMPLGKQHTPNQGRAVLGRGLSLLSGACGRGASPQGRWVQWAARSGHQGHPGSEQGGGSCSPDGPVASSITLHCTPLTHA